MIILLLLVAVCASVRQNRMNKDKPMASEVPPPLANKTATRSQYKILWRD